MIIARRQSSSAAGPPIDWGLGPRLRMKDILKTSSAEEENILGNVALSPPAEEENILANVSAPRLLHSATQFHPFSTLPWDDQYPLHHRAIDQSLREGKNSTWPKASD